MDIEFQRTSEAHRQNLEDAKEAHANQRAFVDFANQSAIELTSSATKAFLVINGGAAVAMLGFVASVSGNQSVLALELSAAISALMWFGWGVAAAAACSGLAYFVMYIQAAQANAVIYTWEHPFVEEKPASKWLRLANTIFHILAVLSGMSALILFILGIHSVADVISGRA